MRRTLFRYRSFNTEKLNDYSYIHQRIINIEKWKFEAFEGLVYGKRPYHHRPARIAGIVVAE